eukprot:GHRR01019050.1.p2 GENE.GHRR01019050.1~~GHRR01019050.1.p2  ORF type:complete len:121 (+),score=22.70 GHRR01019050.1:314-676(+)
MAWPERPETERLFGDSVPSVPVLTSHSNLAPPAGFAGGGFLDENTLDETVWQTLKRDVLTIGRNLRSVLIPVNWDFQNHQAALHNWDLWGPLIFMLGLAITLSIGEQKPSDVFAVRAGHS